MSCNNIIIILYEKETGWLKVTNFYSCYYLTDFFNLCIKFENRCSNKNGSKSLFSSEIPLLKRFSFKIAGTFLIQRNSNLKWLKLLKIKSQCGHL